MNGTNCGKQKRKESDSLTESVKIIIESHYCPESDKTFITEERIEGKKHWLKVIGFYFGGPDYEITLDNLYDSAPVQWEGEEE